MAGGSIDRLTTLDNTLEVSQYTWTVSYILVFTQEREYICAQKTCLKMCIATLKQTARW